MEMMHDRIYVIGHQPQADMGCARTYISCLTWKRFAIASVGATDVICVMRVITAEIIYIRQQRAAVYIYIWSCRTQTSVHHPWFESMLDSGAWVARWWNDSAAWQSCVSVMCWSNSWGVMCIWRMSWAHQSVVLCFSFRCCGTCMRAFCCIIYVITYTHYGGLPHESGIIVLHWLLYCIGICIISCYIKHRYLKSGKCTKFFGT